MSRRDEDWFVQVGREMASLAEELAAGRPRVAGKAYWEPRVDLFEEEGRLLVRAELAGVRAEDIALHYVPERHALIIRGVRADAPLGRGAHLLEIPVGEFVREVALPEVSIDARAIRATCRNGMLLVMVPKIDRVIARTAIVEGTLS